MVGVFQNNSVLQERRAGTKETTILLPCPKKSEKEMLITQSLRLFKSSLGFT